MRYMQNVVNYLAPFFAKDGRPLSGGRVHFVKPDCSAVPTDREDPDYIAIFDTDGVALPNPLGLNDLGQFEIQPFVADGIDFRMLVEGPTGVSATLESEAPAWELLYAMDSKSQKITVSFSGVSTCGGLPDLRKADPASSPAVVLGYSEAGDFCPPRIFKWVGELYEENYGTHVRSTVAGKTASGTWVCEPSGFLDVRWFGVDPAGSASVSESLQRISRSHPNMPAYFPSGTYSLSSGVSLYSAILDRNAKIRCSGANSVEFRVDGHFENRGGRFVAETSDPESVRVVPVVRGTLRTSWLQGTLAEFLTPEALEGIETFVVDSAVVAGNATVTLSKKKVVLFESFEPPNVSLSGCLVADFVQAGKLNVELAGNGLTVGGRDSDGRSARLNDAALVFVKDGEGNTFAKFGTDGAVISDGTDRTEITPRRVYSAKGLFEVLEILGAVSVAGDADFAGNVTVAKDFKVSDIFEAKNVEEGYVSLLFHKMATFDAVVRHKKSVIIDCEGQNLYCKDWSYFGTGIEGLRPNSPGSGIGMHVVKVSDYGYKKVQTDVDKYKAVVDLTTIETPLKGQVYAIYNDLTFGEFMGGVDFKTTASTWNETHNRVFLFVQIPAVGLVMVE